MFSLRSLSIRILTVPTIVVLANFSCANVWAQKSANVSGITANELANMTPKTPNPYLSFLPQGTDPDWEYWNAYMAIHGPARAEERAARQSVRQTPVNFSETEPNNSLIDSQMINFGTAPGKFPAMNVFGEITEPLAPTSGPNAQEDNGSIPLANVVDVDFLDRVVISTKIGDGPHGSKGTKSGDFDFFELSDLEAGETLFLETDTAVPFEGVDTVIAVFDSTGTLIGFNDDEDVTISLDSKLIVDIPFAGDYFVCIGSYVPPLIIDDPPPNPLPSNPFDSGSGPGVASEGNYDIVIGRGLNDADLFGFNLRAGDIVGFNAEGNVTRMTLLDEFGFVRIGTQSNPSLLYPSSSPLPGANRLASAYVIPEDGKYILRVDSTELGTYRVDMRAFRNTFETSGTEGDHQKLFIDFDGAFLDVSIFEVSTGNRILSPLSAFLPSWGLAPDAESTVIDIILGVVEESLKHDLESFSNNPDFDVEILNSRDHPDPFGQPNVSRVIVGGTIAQTDLFTIGIAESIDPGNFDREETAVVLLDLLSAPNGGQSSLNSIARGPTAGIIKLIGEGVGNIVAHEAGHFFGNFHTSNFPFTPACIMDEGGDLPNFIGVGNDNLFGTPDDIDVDFIEDVYSFSEFFTGSEDTQNATAFGLSSTTSNVDPNLIYVDFNKAAVGAGTLENPLNNLGDALVIANSDANIRIEPGSSDETLIISKPLLIENNNPAGGVVRIGAL